MSPHAVSRPGFTLTEVLVALLLVATTLVGVQGATILALRQLRVTASESLSIRLIQHRAELTFAAPCATTSGADTSGVVTTAWAGTTDGRTVHLVQTARYRTPWGERVDAYDATGRCR